MTPNAQHKRAERAARVERGDTRCEVWLSPRAQARLERIMKARRFSKEEAVDLALATCFTRLIP